MSENRASTPEGYRGDWATPWSVIDEIKAAGYALVLDVAASADNKKCPQYLDKERDGLKHSWNVPDGSFWWCNPDFRLASAFLDKAFEEMNAGNPGLMLLPPNIETEWFRRGITERCIRVLFWPKRIQFIDPRDAGKAGGNNKGSILAAFTRQRVLPQIAGQPWWRRDA